MAETWTGGLWLLRGDSEAKAKTFSRGWTGMAGIRAEAAGSSMGCIQGCPCRAPQEARQGHPWMTSGDAGSRLRRAHAGCGNPWEMV